MNVVQKAICFLGRLIYQLRKGILPFRHPTFIMINKADKYSFVIGEQIKNVFTESKLYLDGKYDENTFEALSTRRLDKPLFILLYSDLLVRLCGSSLSIADEYTKEYVFGEAFKPCKKTQNEFKRLHGLTVTEIVEVFESDYGFEEESYFIDPFNAPKSASAPTDLIIQLDNGLRLVCNMCFDYFDIQIVDEFIR